MWQLRCGVGPLRLLSSVGVYGSRDFGHDSVVGGCAVGVVEVVVLGGTGDE